MPFVSLSNSLVGLWGAGLCGAVSITGVHPLPSSGIRMALHMSWVGACIHRTDVGVTCQVVGRPLCQSGGHETHYNCMISLAIFFAFLLRPAPSTPRLVSSRVPWGCPRASRPQPPSPEDNQHPPESPSSAPAHSAPRPFFLKFPKRLQNFLKFTKKNSKKIQKTSKYFQKIQKNCHPPPPPERKAV